MPVVAVMPKVTAAVEVTAIEEEPAAAITATGKDLDREEETGQVPLQLTDDAGQKRVVNWDPDSYWVQRRRQLLNQ